ncbi:MAG: biotin--[acetyl-CoA-carboxylase] ligase [Thermodesulfobacteriota bacterium]
MIRLDVTDSTNSRAMALAEDGAPHGTVVVADSQTGGRGRQGRRWISPPGVNIYVSLLLRPDLPNARVPALSLMAGIALADATDREGVPALLKWPNDLYLGERKAAGILVETAFDAGRLRYAVVGAGINVNLPEEAIPGELRGKATSMRIRAGRVFDREAVLAAFLDAFAERYRQYLAGGFPAVHADWARRDFLRWRRVLLSRPGGEAWGTAQGVDEEGALRFRPDGTAAIERVHGGEILCFS